MTDEYALGIADNAFEDANYFDEGILPSKAVSGQLSFPNITSLGYSAFYDCNGITSITIGENVTSIKTSTFTFCSGLTSITIPNKVESIGNYTFSSCYGLTSVTIPDSVTSIGDSAFIDCTNLTSVTFEGKDRATVQGMTNYPFGLN